MADVLVFLPGILGSELYDGNDKVWPGSGWDAVRGFSEKQFQRLLKPDLEARDIVRSAVGGFVNIYADWISRFESMRRSSDNSRMFVEKDQTLIVVPYDWRKSCVEAAEALAKKIEHVKNVHRAQANIHLVVHSLGGLVARYYLQSGVYDKRDGFDQIRSFITLGTPHNGAPIAFAGVVGLHKTNFLSIDQSKRLANDDRYPSLYQIFPEPDQPLIWERTVTERLKPHNLGDRDFALKALNLTAKSYDSYLNFRSAIAGAFPPQIRRFVMMGTQYDTVTHFYWDGHRLQSVESKDGGDGTVSIQGAYTQGVQCRFTGEAHVTLIRSLEARHTLQEIMGATGLLIEATDVSISVRDLNVTTGQPLHLLIVSRGQLNRVTGELVVEGLPLPANPEAVVSEQETFIPIPGRAPLPFSYNGPDIASAMVRLAGISTPGLYRIAIRQSGSREVLVQSPTFVVSAPQ